MQFHQLRYFVSTVDQKSISDAAKHCFVSQPSLSQQIKKLEQSIGSNLFIREKGRLSLTEEGRILYKEAKEILSMISLAENKVKSFSVNKSHHIGIGILPTILPYVADNILTNLNTKNQEFKAYLNEGHSKDLLESCLKYEIDYAITAGPLKHEELSVHPLIKDPFYVVVKESHHLSQQNSISLEQLQGEPFILVKNIHCLHGQISTIFKNADYYPEVKFETAYIDTIQQLIANGHGISILPAISKKNAKPGLRYIPIKERPSREIVLAHRKDFDHPNIRKLLFDIFGASIST